MQLMDQEKLLRLHFGYYVVDELRMLSLTLGYLEK
jgi:hypothetical protein